MSMPSRPSKGCVAGICISEPRSRGISTIVSAPLSGSNAGRGAIILANSSNGNFLDFCRGVVVPVSVDPVGSAMNNSVATPTGKRVLPVAPSDDSASCLFEAACSKVSPRHGHAPFVTAVPQQPEQILKFTAWCAMMLFLGRGRRWRR